MILSITLLLLLCLCSDSTGERNKRQQCCKKLRSTDISNRIIGNTYKVQTVNKCNVHAIIFRTNNGRVCVDPKVAWVKEQIANMSLGEGERPSNINHGQPTQFHTEPVAIFPGRHSNTDQQCCHSVSERNLSDLITETTYQILPKTADGECVHAIIFTRYDGRRACVDPNAEWVKEQITNMTLGEDTLSGHLPFNIQPCCHMVSSTNIASSIKGTMYHIQFSNGRCVDAIIFGTNDGERACVDPNAQWVKKKTDNMIMV